MLHQGANPRRTVDMMDQMRNRELLRILKEINERPQAASELSPELRGKLEALRAQGVSVPEEIERLARDLEVERMSASQGR
jgi:hypothetical protein